MLTISWKNVLVNIVIVPKSLPGWALTGLERRAFHGSWGGRQVWGPSMAAPRVPQVNFLCMQSPGPLLPPCHRVLGLSASTQWLVATPKKLGSCCHLPLHHAQIGSPVVWVTLTRLVLPRLQCHSCRCSWHHHRLRHLSAPQFPVGNLGVVLPPDLFLK